MTQKQLDRAIAQATGESVATIRQRGFGLIVVAPTKPCPLSKRAEQPKVPAVLQTR